MAYRVIYEIPGESKQKRLHHSCIAPMTMVSFGAFLILVYTGWPEGRASLEELGIAACSAWNSLADRIPQGETFLNSVEAFLNEAIEYARRDIY